MINQSEHQKQQNFINISAETVLYSRFSGHNGRRSKGGEEEAYIFNLILLAN